MHEIVYIGYTGGLGGEAIQMFELAAGAAQRGWKVTVVVPDLPGLQRFALEYSQRPNLTVHLTPDIVFDSGIQNPMAVYRHLAPYVKAPVLHIHTGDICLPRMTLLMLQWLRPGNCFATIHAALPEMTPGSARARFWARASRRLRGIFCPSEQGRQTQLLYGVQPDRAVTIRNGVDVARYASGDPTPVYETLKTSPETPLVITTSRLYDQKRPFDTLAAFAGAVHDLPGALPHLVFVGIGPLEAQLRKRAQEAGLTERVHFVGLQTNIPDWLAATTVWIFPSEAEHASLSLLEALSAGCAVVATHCPGNNEVLQNEKNSLTADVGDVATLTAGLRRLLLDPALRARLGEAGRTTAAEFSRDSMVEKYLAVYERPPV